MKKLLISLLALSGILCSSIDAEAVSITSTPSPAVSNKSLEITISGQDLGSTVYCYTWCDKLGSGSKSPFKWDDVNTSKFQMTGSNGNYTFTISDIKAFYGLTDTELSNLTRLGFIAKNTSGGQTDNLYVDVVQGRRDAYSGGEGTAADPYVLKTAQDLQMLVSTPGDWTSENYFRMDADIDASALTSGIGSTSSPFAAIFDGNGHSIKNLNLTSNSVGSAVGLFSCINGGTVKNLGVTGARVSGATYVGILAGQLRGGSVECCFTTGTVSGSSICVGGLVGENEAGYILNCYSGASVENPDDYAAGGLVGKNRGQIANTYASGSVTGYDYVGGLVGANYGTVKNSLALNSKITAFNDFVARFGGNNNSRNIIESNYSWENIAAGHQSWTSHGDHASAKPADVLRDATQFQTLTGWDFNNIWEWRVEGKKEYPVLRGLSNQDCPLSDTYFSYTTSLQETLTTDGEFSIGPNPTYGELYISSSDGIESYVLYGINGQVVKKDYTGGVTETVVDLSGLPNGLYILRSLTSNGVENINKVIKK